MSPTLVFDIHVSILHILCPIAIASLLVGFTIASYRALHDGIAQLKHLHQIPCDRCVFFTGCYHLKCTVHPSKAMTADAVGCLDFDPAVSTRTPCSPCCKKKALI
jgi:hypothetical protein